MSARKKNPPVKVLQVSAELFPLVKTGGLADVAGALPAALGAAGCEVRLLLPGFDAVLEDLRGSTVVGKRIAPWGEAVTLRAGRLASLGLRAYVIDVPALYRRPGGNPYADPAQVPYPDNHRRFALLGWIAGQLALGMDDKWQADVVHSHDWHAALAPAYLAHSRAQQPRRVGSVHTVHNLAFQGLFSRQQFAELGLPASAFAIEGLEFHGKLSFMKAGLFYADRITTVSPTYAKEIQGTEQGCGLDGLLRVRSDVLSGILNGVDESVWNPAADPQIAATFSAAEPSGKARCKAALQEKMRLEARKDALLFGAVSRLTEQKGMHLLIGAIDGLIARGGQLVVLGSGDAALETALRAKARKHPRSIAVRLGFDEALAHRIFAGSDVTLVPSRYEPCGLTQMYGLKYGSLPLVRRVGGLADTVVDCTLEDLAEGTATGFVFDEFSEAGFARAMARAFVLHARPAEWATVVAHAMRQSFGWQAGAKQYLALYEQVRDLARKA